MCWVKVQSLLQLIEHEVSHTPNPTFQQPAHGDLTGRTFSAAVDAPCMLRLACCPPTNDVARKNVLLSACGQRPKPSSSGMHLPWRGARCSAGRPQLWSCTQYKPKHKYSAWQCAHCQASEPAFSAVAGDYNSPGPRTITCYETTDLLLWCVHTHAKSSSQGSSTTYHK